MSAHRMALLGAVVLQAGALAGCKREGSADKPAGLQASPVSSEATPASPPSSPPPAPAAGASDVETVPAAPDPKDTVSGTITVPSARRKGLAPSDIVFIIARQAGAPPGPGSMIAVQKHPLGEFPMRFTMGKRDSMLPGRPFTGRIDLIVRIDKDGDGLTRKKGDLFGQANNIPVGTQDLAISVDGMMAEDQTLPGIPAVEIPSKKKREPMVHP
jgi:hypothetical protein